MVKRICDGCEKPMDEADPDSQVAYGPNEAVSIRCGKTDDCSGDESLAEGRRSGAIDSWRKNASNDRAFHTGWSIVKGRPCRGCSCVDCGADYCCGDCSRCNPEHPDYEKE